MKRAKWLATGAAIVCMVILSTAARAEIDTGSSYFQFGVGYYHPVVEGWNDVFDQDIIPFQIGYCWYFHEMFSAEMTFGYYAQSGKTVEGPGFDSESVDFRMLPLIVYGTARHEMNWGTPYGSLGVGYAYYSEQSGVFDYSGSTYVISAKGGALFNLNEKWLLFTELFYHYVPGESEEKSLSAGDPDFGGPGIMIGVKLRNTKKSR